ITNSEGASFEAAHGRKILANSQGFLGQYRWSSCSLVVSAIASAGPDKADSRGMQRDYWYTLSRSFAGLESPETVGRTAAEHALRRLAARKIATQRTPIAFDQRTARSLLGHLFEALNGDSIYRGASFLAGKIGQQIASEDVTVVDDG